MAICWSKILTENFKVCNIRIVKLPTSLTEQTAGLSESDGFHLNAPFTQSCPKKPFQEMSLTNSVGRLRRDRSAKFGDRSPRSIRGFHGL